MSSPELFEDFRDMLDALAAERVECVVVGAHALAAHGLPRATGDLDVLVRPTPENARRVVRALLRFGAPVEAHGITTTDFEAPGSVYQIGLPPRRIDLLTRITGVSFDEAWSTKLAVSIGGRSFFVLGRAALLTNKRAAGRPKDLVDVAELERKAEDRP